MKDGISVIIPCYNENKSHDLYERLSMVYSYLKDNFTTFELILVDDGSNDKTFLVCSDFIKGSISRTEVRLVISLEHFGKGHAIKEGIKVAKFSTILFMDADLAVPLSFIKYFFNQMKNNSCLVGERRTFKENRSSWSPIKRKISLLCTFCVNKLLPLSLKDSQCGFKMFNVKEVDNILALCKSNGFMFDAELLAYLYSSGVKIIDIPVWWNNRKSGSVCWCDWIDSFIDLLKISWRFQFRNKVVDRWEKS